MRLFSEFEGERIEDTSSRVEQELAQIRLNLGSAKSLLAFASAKGGVGKSAIATNVAVALALKGRKVALLDADLNSPSVASILGMGRRKVFPVGEAIDPASGPFGLRVLACDILVDSEPPPLSLVEEELQASNNGVRPVEPSRVQMLRRLFGRTRFGAVDFLLVDSAPGLGEIDLIARIAPLTGIVLVSHPSESGLQASRAAMRAAARTHTPVIGIIENMTGFFCANCHSVRPLLPQGDMSALEREPGAQVIGRLPFDPRLAEACDRGVQFVREYPAAPLAKQLVELAGRLDELTAVQAPPRQA
jgi:ATP-binding protein involved in chromosome partitioning